MDKLQIAALSDRKLAECLREPNQPANFLSYVNEALARILIGRQWFAAVPSDLGVAVMPPADLPDPER